MTKVAGADTRSETRLLCWTAHANLAFRSPFTAAYSSLEDVDERPVVLFICTAVVIFITEIIVYYCHYILSLYWSCKLLYALTYLKMWLLFTFCEHFMMNGPLNFVEPGPVSISILDGMLCTFPISHEWNVVLEPCDVSSWIGIFGGTLSQLYKDKKKCYKLYFELLNSSTHVFFTEGGWIHSIKPSCL